jgi:hypothetical protein
MNTHPSLLVLEFKSVFEDEDELVIPIVTQALNAALRFADPPRMKTGNLFPFELIARLQNYLDDPKDRIRAYAK